MKILPVRTIENNAYKTVIKPSEMGDSIRTAQQEIDLLADFPQILRYSDIEFKGTFIVTDGIPVLSDDLSAVEVVLDLNNKEYTIGQDMEISLEVSAEKVGSAEINDVLTDALMVAQAKVILFETRVMAKIKELLDIARSHVNTFEETVEQTL